MMQFRWLLAVALTPLPLPMYAQSLMLKEFAGVWIRGQGRYDTLFIRTDSMFIGSGMDINSYISARLHEYRHWNYLRGDTISFAKSDSPDVCTGKRLGYCGEPGYKITLEGQQLTVIPLGHTSTWFSGTYTRVDAGAP